MVRPVSLACSQPTSARWLWCSVRKNCFYQRRSNWWKSGSVGYKTNGELEKGHLELMGFFQHMKRLNATLMANSFITTYENPTLCVDNIFEECSIEQYLNNLHVLDHKHCNFSWITGWSATQRCLCRLLDSSGCEQLYCFVRAPGNNR